MSAVLCLENKKNRSLIQDVGKCLQKLKRFREALLWFLKGLLLASLPENREVHALSSFHYDAGICSFFLRRYQQAVSHLSNGYQRNCCFRNCCDIAESPSKLAPLVESCLHLNLYRKFYIFFPILAQTQDKKYVKTLRDKIYKHRKWACLRVLFGELPKSLIMLRKTGGNVSTRILVNTVTLKKRLRMHQLRYSRSAQRLAKLGAQSTKQWFDARHLLQLLLLIAVYLIENTQF